MNLTRAAMMAAAADVAVLFVGYVARLSLASRLHSSESVSDDRADRCFSGEGEDRQDLWVNASSAGQNQLVEAVAAANPNTVVVVASPGAVVLPWHRRVPAIVANFLQGQEVAAAVADILFGDAAPSGKLPVTFPENYNVTAEPSSFPGLGYNGSSYVHNGVAYVPWLDPSFAVCKSDFACPICWTGGRL